MLSSDIALTGFASSGEFMAICTDAVCFGDVVSGHLSPQPDTDRLLELRVFNAHGERRYFRDTIFDAQFFLRDIQDDVDPREKRDFVQYLDQDSNYTKETEDGFTQFRTTGGGCYKLPGGKERRKVRLRAYYGESYNGLMTVADWRIVGFEA